MYRYTQTVLPCIDTCNACTDTLAFKIYPNLSIDSCIDPSINWAPCTDTLVRCIDTCKAECFKNLENDENTRINAPKAL